VGLDTHVQDVVGLLEEKDLHGVILVGHSYGGMGITGGGGQGPGRGAHPGYLGNFLPRGGATMGHLSPLFLLIVLQAKRDGWRVIPRGTYGVTTEPDRSWVLSKLTPQSLKTFEQPLRLKNPAIVSARLCTRITCTGVGCFRSLVRRILARGARFPTGAGW